MFSVVSLVRWEDEIELFVMHQTFSFMQNENCSRFQKLKVFAQMKELGKKKKLFFIAFFIADFIGLCIALCVALCIAFFSE